MSQTGSEVRFERLSNDEHKAVGVCETGGEWLVTCSCGARWTHGKEVTEERMHSIYRSHLRYFNRPKMETL